MKYLKTYEKNNFNTPKVGDYVLVNVDYPEIEFINFLSNNIGQIIDIDDSGYQDYHVKYNNVPEQMEIRTAHMNNGYGHAFDEGTWKVDKSEIYAFSKNKEDLKIMIAANKYNI